DRDPEVVAWLEGMWRSQVEQFREEDMVRAGAERFMQAVNASRGEHERIGADRRVLKRLISDLREDMEALRQQQVRRLVEGTSIKGKWQRRAAAAVFSIDAERLAYILVRSALGYRLSRHAELQIDLEADEISYCGLAQ